MAKPIRSMPLSFRVSENSCTRGCWLLNLPSHGMRFRASPCSSRCIRVPPDRLQNFGCIKMQVPRPNHGWFERERCALGCVASTARSPAAHEKEWTRRLSFSKQAGVTYIARVCAKKVPRGVKNPRSAASSSVVTGAFLWPFLRFSIG
jgi:hypothetical protein